MLALPSREARRLVSVRGTLAIAVGVLSLTSCRAETAHVRAERLDIRSGTSVFTWLADHEPSRLDVLGVSPATLQSLAPQSHMRSAVSDIPTACRNARRARALLLVFVRSQEAVRRAAVLDCGFALERDAAAVVVAPR